MVQEDGFKQPPSAGLRPRDEADAVEDERVAGEHVEQQDALKDPRQIERQLEAICALSPPMKVSARNRPAIRMPIGLSRPRNATMIAVKP